MIVVGGEALVDLVPEDPVPPPQLAPLAPRLGGGPYNVAIALARMGSPTSFLSRISRDRFGQALLEHLRECGVDVSLVQRGEEPTTLAVVAPEPDGSARYSFYTDGTADRLVADPGPQDARVGALSLGTLSLVLEPGATTYERMLLRESARGVFVALDPNVRGDLIADPAAYRRRFESWLPHVGLLKLSVEDARWLAADGESDPVSQARHWAELGPAAVVLTRGSDGISVLTPDGARVDVAGRRSEVVDTIGAGDTVQAALLHWLDRHDALDAAAVAELTAEDWRAALDFAATAAAITCSRPGADPPSAAELGAA
ncbi:fructokinase [Haloactinospora alba]|uniref:Fructokinase n=1 Tax=Haloactinospora alba TaxID=405555 RepID=A0A543N969_9ACTN|nr:carbohydrate kinase [Haloactinospora alba]TQN28358.1 fructokinase [Haloactinospora alba]